MAHGMFKKLLQATMQENYPTLSNNKYLPLNSLLSQINRGYKLYDI